MQHSRSTVGREDVISSRRGSTREGIPQEKSQATADRGYCMISRLLVRVPEEKCRRGAFHDVGFRQLTHLRGLNIGLQVGQLVRYCLGIYYSFHVENRNLPFCITTDENKSMTQTA